MIGLSILASVCTAPVQAGQMVDHIELVCAARDSVECSALQTALASRTPKSQIAVVANIDLPENPKGQTLRIQLQVLRREPDFIVAQMVWTSAGNTPVTGPMVEVSTNDRNLTSKAPVRLAQGLLKASNLPI
jgi:hypothetical protein